MCLRETSKPRLATAFRLLNQAKANTAIESGRMPYYAFFQYHTIDGQKRLTQATDTKSGFVVM